MTKVRNHIGGLIKKKMEEDGRSVKWLADKIQCKRRNVYDIYDRTSIDSGQLLRISMALKTNFFTYFSKIYEKRAKITKNTDFETCCLLPVDEIHIGNLIKKKLKEKGRSVNWLAGKILCKRANVYNIINNRDSIDTTQLFRICIALETNFFGYYSVLFGETEK
jgi:plasmid maintenance system antidote protein VapI